jgi:hypothetical protein
MLFFNVYQYLAPLILLPLSYVLWWERMGNSHPLAILMLSIPVLFAYVIPAVGMNWLRLWEMNTRFKFGHFRPHHGFVFGSAIGLGALLCVGPPAAALSWYGLAQAGFLTGSTMAFWNWLYDLYAIKAGFLIVHIRPHARGLGAEATATDYAPLYFGAFGVCLGISIYLGQYLLLTEGRRDLFWPLLILFNLLTLAIPTLLYMGASYLKYGDVGLQPVSRDGLNQGWLDNPPETRRQGGGAVRPLQRNGITGTRKRGRHPVKLRSVPPRMKVI